MKRTIDDTQSIDIYSNSNTTLQPIIFYVHGGAWHLGNTKNASRPCNQLLSAGYVAVAPSYKLTMPSNNEMVWMFAFLLFVMFLIILAYPGYKLPLFGICSFILVLYLLIWSFLPDDTDDRHPRHINDLAKAYKWTVEHASEFGGDPSKIIVMGHSAGGHLVSLLATNNYYLDQQTIEKQFYPKAVISISGVYSDKRLAQSALQKQLLKKVFGNRSNYIDAFPIYNVTEDSPPFMLINAGFDMDLLKHTLDMTYTLKQHGVRTKVIYDDSKTHWNITDISNQLDEIKDFTKGLL